MNQYPGGSPWGGVLETPVDDEFTQDPSEGQYDPFAQNYEEPAQQQQAYYNNQPLHYPQPQPPAPVSEYDAEMSEVERRITKAMFYREALSCPLFAEGGGAIAAEVEQEFRDFARERLGELMGMAPKKPTSSLSEIEVRVLQIIAQSAIANNPNLAKAVDKPKPVAARRPAPQQPQQRPAPVQPRHPDRPSMRPRPLPEGVQPQQPRPPARPPVQQPQQQRPPQQPPQQRRPQPQQVQQPQQPQQPQRPQQQQLDPQYVPADEELIQIGGKPHKVKWREMSQHEFGSTIAQQLDQLPLNGATILPNGLQVIKASDGTFFKVLKQDLSVQAKSPTSIPFPSPHHMSMVMAEHAEQSLQVASQNDPSMRKILGALGS